MYKYYTLQYIIHFVYKNVKQIVERTIYITGRSLYCYKYVLLFTLRIKKHLKNKTFCKNLVHP